jgi:hypothetical protein
MKQEWHDVVHTFIVVKKCIDSIPNISSAQAAEIFKELGNPQLARTVISHYIVNACIAGDVSKAVMWAIIFSHFEGLKPDPHAQSQAMHLIAGQ